MSRCTSCGHDESAHFAMSLNGACCVIGCFCDSWRAPASDAGTGPRETQGEQERIKAEWSAWLDNPGDDYRPLDTLRAFGAGWRAALRSAPPGEPSERAILAAAEVINEHRRSEAIRVHHADVQAALRVAYRIDATPGEPEQPESEGERIEGTITGTALSGNDDALLVVVNSPVPLHGLTIPSDCTLLLHPLQHSGQEPAK